MLVNGMHSTIVRIRTPLLLPVVTEDGPTNDAGRTTVQQLACLVTLSLWRWISEGYPGAPWAIAFSHALEAKNKAKKPPDGTKLKGEFHKPDALLSWYMLSRHLSYISATIHPPADAVS